MTKLNLRVSTALASLAACGATALLVAPTVAFAQPIHGIYVSLGAGGNLLQDETLKQSSQFPSGRLRFGGGLAGAGAVGWGFGNGFRVEVEGNYRQNGLQHFLGTAFPTSSGGKQENYGGMLNVLFDMDIGRNWIYPYFGAGVGYSWTRLDTWYSGSNYPYVNNIQGTDGNFAYQGIFGLSFPIAFAPGLSMTAEYRFFSVLGDEHFGGNAFGANNSLTHGVQQGRQSIKTDYNHSAMLGLRYAFDTAPPPVAAPAPVSAPAPEAARTYLVFFDWDRSNLTPRARQIVAEAAQASTHVQTTRIEVNGYTDTSSARGGAAGAKYNEGLSVRRATTVKAELIHDGVPASAIDIHGYGESHPLVPTGPNAREPQNRRVEIILH
ncbi:outer membrane protein OmpA-like peptidoglycan-associated protein [Endobacter medicaginis]|uniref:OmpA family protein n=1 Tax=Endobacter medicaginis TaxID=1181271 RepID=A0A839V411_9PROT|nr:OmpA family protein [Endobacter medicaginis]MBB3174269.1 outer membrane protein OmpA-like peptidoglycan-associated protein [Endobacter medicaginis]MCX5476819.1 OmpA family protein [Endobacter medicaginis]NVN31236.1 OmpA family protein [Endobacter medicaginis]